MSLPAYLRLELLRTARNRFFLFFSIGFPLILYFIIAGPNKGESDFAGTGIPAPLYYMVSLASFGTMTAVLASGTRIAIERETGWTRQLRISPLSTTGYFGAKVVTAYASALATILLLMLAGRVLGVGLAPGELLETIALILVALIPFAAGGVALGHVLKADSVGPAMGGGTAILALLSGTWFPITSGFLMKLGELLPSWWLVQASRAGIGGEAWPLKGWAVVVVWSVWLTLLARKAYARDTGR